MKKRTIDIAISDYKDRIDAMKSQIEFAKNYGVNATIEKYLLMTYSEFVKVLEKIEKEI